MRTKCPSGFTHIASANGCYKKVHTLLNWTSAELNCRSLHRDAHLLVVSDAAEMLALGEILGVSLVILL